MGTGSVERSPGLLDQHLVAPRPVHHPDDIKERPTDLADLLAGTSICTFVFDGIAIGQVVKSRPADGHRIRSRGGPFHARPEWHKPARGEIPKPARHDYRFTSEYGY
jgi:hypothetical protein